MWLVWDETLPCMQMLVNQNMKKKKVFARVLESKPCPLLHMLLLLASFWASANFDFCSSYSEVLATMQRRLNEQLVISATDTQLWLSSLSLV